MRLSGKVIPDTIPTRFTAHIAPKPCNAVIKKHLIGCFDLKAKISIVSIISANENITIDLIPKGICKLLKTVLNKVYKEFRTNIPYQELSFEIFLRTNKLNNALPLKGTRG